MNGSREWFWFPEPNTIDFTNSPSSVNSFGFANDFSSMSGFSFLMSVGQRNLGIAASHANRKALVSEGSG